MADDNRRGLPRPQAPVDLFTLQPEPDLVAPPAERPARRQTRPQPQSRTAAAKKGRASTRKKKAAETAAPPPKRIKTSVELSPETLDLISRLKSQHRRRTRKHLPMWRILEEAVREMADRQLK